MYLEKIEIKGFKSFSAKTGLAFPKKGANGRGITAIVGPNGSGKSNIADAIRWCLGEQSMKSLRAKNNDDIIFSGSSTKGKLGMAEVSLFLNNEDKRAPIDYSELVITRKAYRNGENEYLINNSKTRLSDIQMLLAKANFGQKTYSVIGQGMVDNFLGRNPTERKDFFDEATGVKKFQIKRDEAIRKLINTHENLAQANMLIAEIEPHLRSLTRQVNKLKKKNEIEKDLKQARTEYYKYCWHDLNDKFNQANSHLLDLEKDYQKKTKEAEKINDSLSEMEKDSMQSDEYSELNRSLNKLYAERESIIKKMAGIQTQLSMEFEASGNFDLSWLTNRENELKKEINETKDSVTELENDIKIKKARSKDLEEEKKHINERISNLNQKLLSLNEQDKNETKEEKDEKITKHLQELKNTLKALELEEDLQEIKKSLKKIKNLIEEISSLTGKKKNDDNSFYVKQREIQDELASLTQKREEIIEKFNSHSLEINSLAGKIMVFNDELSRKNSELAEIQTKINKNRGQDPENKTLHNQKGELEKKLAEIDGKISEVKKRLGEIKNEEEERRSKIFKLQKEGQALQNEINELGQKINSLKIESAKHETKLEDLETDIRQFLDNLREIREERLEKDINPDEWAGRIKRLSSQYAQIGGIDPEVEKEFEETKKKYDFLYEQSNDLEETIKTLEKVIKELDEKIKEKFSTEFKIICKKFEEYFKILFGGGNAKIIKLSGQDLKKESPEKQEKEPNGENKILNEKETSKDRELAEKVEKLSRSNATGLAGIDIQANPPGKAIKSINVLSGGEKAMTAIALICAIINVNPSPFVVLDEIDAALDEANAERLSRIIVDLSDKTQFILITHNRAPMHKADVLYGVTMKDNGISQLLSMKLEDYLKK